MPKSIISQIKGETMQNNRTNTLQGNAYIDSKRRQALKDLKDLSLIGAGGILGIKALRDAKTSFDSTESSLYPHANTLDSTQALESSPISNIPSQILSLPLKYFNVPQIYTLLLESKIPRKQRENLAYIVPLLTSKNFDYTMPSLYHSYNVENINTHKIYNETSEFLTYHYDTLGVLLKDLQTHNFISRDYRALTQDSMDLSNNLLQEILQNLMLDNAQFSLDSILKYQVPKDSRLYREFKIKESREISSAIDAYNEALAILAEYFAARGSDTDKARRLLKCLDIIGKNNIVALYIGTNSNIGESQHDKKRPKFIGRLATTIIIDDRFQEMQV